MLSTTRCLSLLLLLHASDALRVGSVSGLRPTIRDAAAASPALPSAAALGSIGSSHDSAATAAALAAGAALLAVVEPAAAADVGSTTLLAVQASTIKGVLQPLLSIGTIAFLCRVVLSWFPKYNLKELPWAIVAVPTEPILKPTRSLIPPVAGVDISPIVWVAILSFFSEILCGPQGLLTIMQKKGM